MNTPITHRQLLAAAFGFALLAGCASNKNCCPPTPNGCPVASVSTSSFGSTAGRDVTLTTLRNKQGAVATISTYGGTITSLKVPDRDRRLVDVVLGCDSLDAYLKDCPYLGCVIGRYGNRIAGARFSLDGAEYKLAANNGPNNLHAGPNGFDKRVWTATPAKCGERDDCSALQLNYRSADGEEGFPGNLDVTALYCLTDDNELKVTLTAKTDKTTVCNLTYHPYFNLSGAGNGDILDTLVEINAARFTPVNSVQVPTGELHAVAGTPFDFTKPTAIGARIDADDEQIKFGVGYDHNWVINQAKPGALTLQARATSPKTGITMEVHSTAPAVQFYSGNFLDGTVAGKGGLSYPKRSGFCLEPQFYPDSPNQPTFPSTTLKPGQIWQNTIIYKFTAK